MTVRVIVLVTVDGVCVCVCVNVREVQAREGPEEDEDDEEDLAPVPEPCGARSGRSSHTILVAPPRYASQPVSKPAPRCQPASPASTPNRGA